MWLLFTKRMEINGEFVFIVSNTESMPIYKLCRLKIMSFVAFRCIQNSEL